MLDKTTTVQELKDLVAKFIDEREWTQFHAPKNLSISIALEAAELMEKFQWCSLKESHDEAKTNRDEVEQELADVIITALCFARITNINVVKAIQEKMLINAKKYPVSKAKGRYTKYNKLD